MLERQAGAIDADNPPGMVISARSIYSPTIIRRLPHEQLPEWTPWRTPLTDASEVLYLRFGPDRFSPPPGQIEIDVLLSDPGVEAAETILHGRRRRGCDLPGK